MLNYQRVDHFYWKPHEVFGYPFLYLVASPSGTLRLSLWMVPGKNDWTTGIWGVSSSPNIQESKASTAAHLEKWWKMAQCFQNFLCQLEASFQWLSVHKLLLKWAQIQPTAPKFTVTTASTSAMDLMEAHRAARPGHWATSHAWPVQEGVSPAGQLAQTAAVLGGFKGWTLTPLQDLVSSPLR